MIFIHNRNKPNPSINQKIYNTCFVIDLLTVIVFTKIDNKNIVVLNNIKDQSHYLHIYQIFNSNVKLMYNFCDKFNLKNMY